MRHILGLVESRLIKFKTTAERKQLSLEETEQLLAPILAYEPTRSYS